MSTSFHAGLLWANACRPGLLSHTLCKPASSFTETLSRSCGQSKIRMDVVATGAVVLQPQAHTARSCPRTPPARAFQQLLAACRTWTGHGSFRAESRALQSRRQRTRRYSRRSRVGMRRVGGGRTEPLREARAQPGRWKWPREPRRRSARSRTRPWRLSTSGTEALGVSLSRRCELWAALQRMHAPMRAVRLPCMQGPLFCRSAKARRWP